ncbi:hypothetical protein [Egbenema bharatensis]|uniref:hypothetical protein n=1 Tax=Egbenema bharatensis TaxID=3463334 RepID=UPI003A8AB02F
MPSRLPPVSIRYLKARLSVLRRPSVWGSAALLLMSLVVLAEHWSQPDRFTGLRRDRSLNPEALDSASPADQPAPLDPFSVVAEPSAPEDLQSQPGFNNATAPQVDQTTNPAGLQLINPTAQAELEILNRLFLEPLSVPSLPVPIPAQIADSPTPASRPSNGAMNPTEATRRHSSTPDSGAASPNSGTNVSPLQAALDRHAGVSTPSDASASTPSVSQSISSPTAQAEPSIEPTPATVPLNLPRPYLPQPLPGQPSTNQTFPQPIYIPQTSPAPGSTGYTLPASLRVLPPTIGVGDSSTMLTAPQTLPGILPPPVTLPTTVQPETFGTVQPQLTRPDSTPFSVPRSAPGRTIGGGQINTFSNP